MEDDKLHIFLSLITIKITAIFYLELLKIRKIILIYGFIFLEKPNSCYISGNYYFFFKNCEFGAISNSLFTFIFHYLRYEGIHPRSL